MGEVSKSPYDLVPEKSSRSRMTEQRRRTHRKVGTIPIALVLRLGVDGDPLTPRIPGLLRDISLEGAGLSLARMRVDDYHIFYSPQDEPSQVLHLEIPLSDTEDDTLAIPITPVWFDRGSTDDVMPFQLGVEFLLESDRERRDLLKKWIRQTQKGAATWWKPSW